MSGGTEARLARLEANQRALAQAALTACTGGRVAHCFACERAFATWRSAPDYALPEYKWKTYACDKHKTASMVPWPEDERHRATTYVLNTLLENA